jgi:transcriptional regulator with XRE-family HTH domain
MAKLSNKKKNMAYNIDFMIANSSQIEAELCRRLVGIRLSRNMTQRQLADQAGVSPRTIGRLEKGQGVSLDTFIRVLMALGIQHSLEGLLPDPSVRPMERIGRRQGERQRAHPRSRKAKAASWTWGDDRE